MKIVAIYTSGAAAVKQWRNWLKEKEPSKEALRGLINLNNLNGQSYLSKRSLQQPYSQTRIPALPPPLFLHHDLSTYGEQHQIGGVPQLQFFHDVGAVRFDSCRADKQVLRYFPIRFPFREQLKDFPFTSS